MMPRYTATDTLLGMSAGWKNSCQIVGWILLSPLIFVLYLLFVVIWLLFTVLGIGPLCQWYFTKQDQQLLNREKIINENSDICLVNIPKGIHSAVGE